MSVVTFGSGPGTMVYQALRLAGQLTPGATAGTDLLNDALYEMNKFIDSSNAQPLAQYFFDDRYFAINVSQQAYTLGPTGTFNTDIHAAPLLYRPERIVRANLILLSTGSPVRVPIQIITVDDYADIPVINVASQVITRMYVQMTKDNITLYMFPYPTVGNQIEFFMWPGFPQFASLTSQFDGPPGYQDWFESALARRMYQLNTKDVGVAKASRLQELRNNEIAARRIVEASNANNVMPKLLPDLATSDASDAGAPFNYLYGDYSQ